MTLSRRQFMGSSVLALGAYAAMPQAAVKAAEPADASAIDKAVVLMGDNVPHRAADQLDKLKLLLQKHEKAGDFYLKEGAVGELEQKFSALLGKEDAVFMPTGTLANHVAVRLLCGDSRHALVQEESHLYRDEADGASTLSGINMVALAPGRTAPSMAEIRDAVDRAENGPYPIKVGAISLESPVRRMDGATVPAAFMTELAAFARSKNIGMHLDGARLLLMCGMSGFDAKSYCTAFDTVYVSLYKYLDAPFGGVLAGSKALMAKARDLRHVFGGTIFHGWQSALLALDTLDGFEQRFAAVRKAGDALLERLEATSGFKVHRVEQGSNIAFVEISAKRQAGLDDRMKAANVMLGKLHEGKVQLTFNETLLRRDTDYLLSAFKGA